jgi:hypothetical protein
MQDGFTANTTHGSTLHVVRSGGRGGGAATYKGVEGGDGIGFTLRKESPDGNRGHQRSGSLGSRRASRAESQDRGNDFESVTQTDGVGPMARVRGCIQRVPDGAGTNTECSTENSRERRPYHRGKARLVLPSVEARAYSARLDTPLMPTAPSAGGRVGKHTAQHGSSMILVREGPAGRAPIETGGDRPRGRQYKDYYATIPARRTWTKGHWYYGKSEGAGRKGDERYHPDRRPQYSRTRTDRRRRFHAGRTPVLTPLASREGVRTSFSSSSSSSGGRGLAFQKLFLISGQGIWFDCSVFLAVMFAEI